MGGQADGQPLLNEQTYLDSDNDVIQASPGDFPATDAQMAIDPRKYDGWENLPPLAHSAPIGRDPYFRGSPDAQALAAAPGLNDAAAAPDSNIETINEFTG